MKRSDILDRLITELFKVDGMLDMITCVQAAETALNCFEYVGLVDPTKWESEDIECGAV